MSSSSSFKIAEFRKAELALAKQIALFEEMKQDPALKKELEFSDKLEEFLQKHGMNRAKLMAFLSMQVSPTDDLPVKAKAETKAGGVKRGPKVGFKPVAKPPRIFVNPHTNERIEVKRIDHGVYKAWIAQYGELEVKNWEVYVSKEA